MTRSIPRGLEAFLFVLLSAFTAQITIAGDRIDLSQPDSLSRVGTALLAAVMIAVRHTLATTDTRS